MDIQRYRCAGIKRNGEMGLHGGRELEIETEKDVGIQRYRCTEIHRDGEMDLHRGRELEI